jgi:hypothetical protein
MEITDHLAEVCSELCYTQWATQLPNASIDVARGAVRGVCVLKQYQRTVFEAFVDPFMFVGVRLAKCCR